MTHKYDPEALPPAIIRWATQVKGRNSAQFKYHTSLGLARSAVNSRYPNGEGIIYHLDDNGEWVKFYEIPKPSCSRCKTDDPGKTAHGRRGRFETYRPGNLKGELQINLPILCSNCREEVWKIPRYGEGAIIAHQTPYRPQKRTAELVDGEWKFSW